MIRLGMMGYLCTILKSLTSNILFNLSKFDELEKNSIFKIFSKSTLGRIDSLEATTSSKIYPPIYKERVKQTIQSEILLERIIQ
jgi:hypothetical protein